MIEVTAIANGYYGQKVRIVGEKFGIDKPEDFSENWMVSDDPKVKKASKAEAPAAPDTRRVNTGGTDGVVGAEIPKAGAKLSAPERVAAARSLTGRDDIKTAKEADEILAAAAASAGSDNDDRSRDMAIDQSQNAPAPDAADGDI